MKLSSYRFIPSAYDRPDYRRLTQGSLGRHASARVSVAIRLILDGHSDCRAFDNCFEMGDAEKVIAGLVAYAIQNGQLRAKLAALWSGSLDAEGFPNGWLAIYAAQNQSLAA